MSEFKKGDYIVTLKISEGYTTDCAKENYCFKQKCDNGSLSVEDLFGYANGNSGLRYGKTNNLLDWRYATPEEIAEYDRLGKPYDVTTLKKAPASTPPKPKKLYCGLGAELIVGEKYKHNTGEIAYYCGLSTIGRPAFEFLTYQACPDVEIENYIPKGNNTYWCFENLNLEFSKIISESLLDQVKAKYPIGTMIKNMHWNGIVGDGMEVVNSYSENEYGIHGGNCYIYCTGKWAEIIKEINSSWSNNHTFYFGNMIGNNDCPEDGVTSILNHDMSNIINHVNSGGKEVKKHITYLELAQVFEKVRYEDAIKNFGKELEIDQPIQISKPKKITKIQVL